MSLIIRATHVTLHAEATRLEARRAALQQELAQLDEVLPPLRLLLEKLGPLDFSSLPPVPPAPTGKPRETEYTSQGPCEPPAPAQQSAAPSKPTAFAHGAAYVSPSDTNSANTGSDSDNRGRAWPNAFRSWEAGTVDAEEDPS